MNDLRKKDDDTSDGTKATGENLHEASHLYYAKLEAYLLLLYQAYLKKETLLEPEIKAAIWRMVQFRTEFPMKIRMLQLELLSFETDNFDGEWDEIKDSLFPIKEFELHDELTTERKKQIREYKDEVTKLLRRSS